MTTLELEVALMDYLNPRQNIVVPNVFWGMGLLYECDMVKLTSAGYATEIEIKMSKTDYNRDKKKRHFHDSKLFKYFYYAVPEDLADYVEENLPEGVGLLIGYPKNHRVYVREKVKAAIRRNHIKWTPEQRLQLLRLGTMRISVLKQNLLNLQIAYKKIPPSQVPTGTLK